MNQYDVYVGVDVAKRTLEVSDFDGGASGIANTPAGIRGLIRRLETLEQSVLVCCEATGGYEKLLAGELLEAGIPIAVVNPRRVRCFAQSKGLLAKTDRIDAQVLGEFARVQQPRTLRTKEPWQEELQALIMRRQDVTEMIKAENSRLDPAPPASVKRMIQTHVRSLQRQIQAIDKQMTKLQQQHTELDLLVTRITKVKGIGSLSALALLGFVPELGTVTDNEAAALVGVAPYNCDSGPFKGKRRTHGGRAPVRRILYMAATSASRSNPILREFYQRLRASGKAHKVAVVAVMRKLVILTNRLIADPDFQLT